MCLAALKVEEEVTSRKPHGTIHVFDPAYGSGGTPVAAARYLQNVGWRYTGTIPGSPIFSVHREEEEALPEEAPCRRAVLKPLWRAREVMAGAPEPETSLLIPRSHHVMMTVQ